MCVLPWTTRSHHYVTLKLKSYPKFVLRFETIVPTHDSNRCCESQFLQDEKIGQEGYSTSFKYTFRCGFLLLGFALKDINSLIVALNEQLTLFFEWGKGWII